MVFVIVGIELFILFALVMGGGLEGGYALSGLYGDCYLALPSLGRCPAGDVGGVKLSVENVLSCKASRTGQT